MRRLALVFSLLIAGVTMLLAGALPASAAVSAIAPSSVTLTSSQNPSPAGQDVTFTATVSSGGVATIPQGTVTFSINGTAITPAVTLSAAGAPAVHVAAMPAAGVFTVVAVYSGDAAFTGSTSNTVSQTVTGASMSPSASPSMSATTITVTPDVNRVNYVNLQTNIPPVQMHAADSAAMTATFTWSATGLPPGLVISTAGVITGSPTTAGTYDTAVTAAEAAPGAGKTGTARFTWTITGANAATPAPVPSASVIPVGGVVTGGGGTASGGSGAILLAVGSVLILAGGGTGALAWRSRRGGRS